MADTSWTISLLAHKHSKGMRGTEKRWWRETKRTGGVSDHSYCVLEQQQTLCGVSGEQMKMLFGQRLMCKSYQLRKSCNRQRDTLWETVHFRFSRRASKLHIFLLHSFVHTNFFSVQHFCVGVVSSPHLQFFGKWNLKLKQNIQVLSSSPATVRRERRGRSRDSKMTISLFFSTVISLEGNRNHMLAAVWEGKTEQKKKEKKTFQDDAQDEKE